MGFVGLLGHGTCQNIRRGHCVLSVQCPDKSSIHCRVTEIFRRGRTPDLEFDHSPLSSTEAG